MARPDPSVIRAQAAFGQRLRSALEQAGLPASATLIRSKLYSLDREAAPTIYTARKWLRGEAIPVQYSAKQLAAWLNVAPAWLWCGDFGNGAARDTAGPADAAPREHEENREILELLSLLDRHDHDIATAFIRLLLRTSRAPD